jgi:hypothetical protein
LRGALAALAAAALVACGGPASPPTSPSSAEGARALRVTGEGLDGRIWLAVPAMRARAAGAGPLEVIGAEASGEGDHVGAFVEMPENECALALARASVTIGDVDLFAYDDAGDVVASDEGPESEATLMVCPPHPRRVYVVARVVSGMGLLAVGVHPVPVAAADAVAGATGARGRPGEGSGKLESWPGLEQKIAAHRAALGARWEDVRRVALPVVPRAPSRVSFDLEAGRCADVLAVPADDVGSIELVAEDDAGRIVARARDRGRDRSLVLCSSMGAPVSIAVRPRGSQGLVALLVGRSQVGAEAEVARRTSVDRLVETRDLPEAQALHAEDIEGRGYGAAKALGPLAAKVGGRKTVPIELPAGCARIDVVAGKPLGLVQAELWDAGGTLLGEGRGGTVAPVFACGPGGAARVDVEALARPGPFAVELRKDASAPAALVAHPIAASRLLGRLHAAGEPATAASASGAEVVALEPETRKALRRVFAGPACLDVIAALDGGGTGLEIRLADRTSSEGGLATARYVASNRLCVGPGAAVIDVELRLAAGKADALLLTRIVPGP